MHDKYSYITEHRQSVLWCMLLNKTQPLNTASLYYGVSKRHTHNFEYIAVGLWVLYMYTNVVFKS